MIAGFWDRFRALPGPVRLLECGTLQRPGAPPSQRRDEALAIRRDAAYVGLDLAAGPGVDVVADLHDLPFPDGHFAAALLCSVLEHVRRPWVVALQLARTVRPGGLLYCQTHQSFPLHDHPGDYFRFSADALREVFAPDAGWRAIEAGHEYPAQVVPLGNYFAHARGWNFEAPAWLNSWVLCERA